LTAPDNAEEVLIDFDFPDAISPAELGRNADPRRLGLALERIILERRG
jgi:hypothetical protein